MKGKFCEIVMKGQGLQYSMDDLHMVAEIDEQYLKSISSIKMETDFLEIKNCFYLVKIVDQSKNLTSKLFKAEALDIGYENIQYISVDDISQIRPLKNKSLLLQQIKKSLGRGK